MAKTAAPQPNTTAQYPFFVQQLGQRAKNFYDTLYTELTSEPDPMTPELAEFVIREEWDELWPHLHPDDDGTGA